MKRPLKFYILLLSLGFCGLEFWIGIPQSLQLLLLGMTLLTVGIPHGALDHEVESYWKSKNQASFDLKGFLVKYLSWMAVLTLLWIWFPGLSLIGFLLISAWHFGETDLQPAGGRDLLSGLLYLVYGLAILAVILLPNLEEAGDILIAMGQDEAWNPEALALIQSQRLVWMAGIAGLLFLLLLLHPRRQEWMGHFAWVIPFGFLLWQLPLWVSFSLYFGGWHSLKALGDIRSFLSSGKQYWTWKKMMLKVLPLGILSVFGLVFIAIAGYLFLNPFSAIFIFISVLTLPHALVMGKMYR